MNFNVAQTLPSTWLYDFIVALDKAIIAYADEALARESEAFRYRDADLRVAVERQLYYAFNTNQALRGLYARYRQEGKDATAALGAAMRLQLSPKWRPGVRHVLSQLLPAAARRAPARVEPPRRADVDVLFLLTHERFQNFWLPITEAGGFPSAFLTIMNETLAESTASQTTLPVLNAPAAGPERQPGRGLNGMSYLANAFDAAHDVLARLRPRAVVVPEGGAPVYEAVNQTCKQLGIPTLCIQQGWSPYVHAGNRNLNFSAMAVWGEKFADFLKPHSPAQRFSVTGSHMVETADVPEGRAISFFISGAPSKIAYETLTTESMYRDFIALAHWAAENFPATTVQFREHPQIPLTDEEKAPLSTCPNLRLVSAEPLAAVLSRSMLSVAIYSTTILDSIAAGVVPIIFNPTALPRYRPDIALDGAGLELKTVPEARAALGRAVTDAPYLAAMRARLLKTRGALFVRTGKPAAKAVADLISELIL